MKIIDLKKFTPKELVPGFHLKVVHSEFMTLTYWEIDAGAILPEHSHPNEQVTTMIEGEFELTVDGETTIINPGTVVVISPDAVHWGKAVTDCTILDVFYPIREDY